MINIENVLLSKEIIKALKEVRAFQDSGRDFSTEEIVSPLTDLYSQNLIEPKTIEINGEKLMTCHLTDFGLEILRKIDSEAE